MTILSIDLRNKLKDAVVAARDIAEAGSRAALEVLAVHHHEPYGHMAIEERRLRKKLRIHARQLGDQLDQNSGAQAIDRLVTECAYEHWHRMLFARFLAENHLLIEPETGVAISLEECEELAREEGLDTWSLAGCYAQKMLPQIFRPQDPLLQVQLARNHQLPLEDILKKLASDTFTAADSLGWVYQFWQTKKRGGQRFRGKDWRTGIARRNPAFHRALYGQFSDPQHPGGLVFWQDEGSRPKIGRKL